MLGFWICQPYTSFWINLGSEYALRSEYARVTKGSVESAPSYMFDMVLNIPYVLRILGLEYKRVCEYATVTQGSV